MGRLNTSLKTKIYEYIKEQYPDWIRGATLERKAMDGYFNEKTYSASNAGRRARELAETPLIERRVNGKLVEYRYKPQRYGVLDNPSKWTDKRFVINGQKVEAQQKLV